MNDKKLIQLARKIIYVKNGDKIGNTYNKWYYGKKVPHITLQYKEKKRGEKISKVKYLSVPVSIYDKANKLDKYTPVDTLLDTRYNGKRMKQQLFEGQYTRDEIRNYTQTISNKLQQRGQDGKISVSVRFFGTYRSGGLANFGENVKIFNPDEYNWEGDIPEVFDGFSIILTQ